MTANAPLLRATSLREMISGSEWVCFDESKSSVAAPEKTCCSAGVASGGIWLVHRGLRHRELARDQSVVRGVGMNWRQPSNLFLLCNAGAPTRGASWCSVSIVSASALVQGSRGRTDSSDLSLGWMDPNGYQGASQIHKWLAVDP